MKIYTIHKIIPGKNLGFAGKDLIAIPQRYLDQESVKVMYNGRELRTIEKGEQPLTRRMQNDKFRSGTFLLSYFEKEVEKRVSLFDWKEVESEEIRHKESINHALSKMHTRLDRVFKA